MKMNNRNINFLTTPPTPKPGQVWRAVDMEQDILITDTSFYQETGVVRGLVLSSVSNAGDKFDKLVHSGEAEDCLFGGSRVALRGTNGPLPFSTLDFFMGTVHKKKFTAILTTLHIPREYSGERLHYLNMLLDQLEPYRWQAVALAEQAAVPKIFCLPKRKAPNNLNPFTYPLAASSGADNKEQEFWDRQEKCAQSIRVEESQKLTAELTFMDGALYFCVWSEDVKRVTGVALQAGRIVVHPEDTGTLTLGGQQRAVCHFKPGRLTPGTWELHFTENRKKRCIPVELAWTE